jgi:phage terminase small subunit
MSTRRRKSTKPIGGGGARNPASLANLIPGAGHSRPGDRRALAHGGYASASLIADVTAETREIMDGIAEVAPVSDAADVLAIEACAVSLKRWRSVVAYRESHGWVDEKGNPKPIVNVEHTAEGALWRALGNLGLHPQSRARLGLTLAKAQAFDLAAAWQAQDEEGGGNE